MLDRAGKPVERSCAHRLRTLTTATALALLAATGTTLGAQTAVPVVTGNARIDNLLSQMTLEEKTALIRGASEDPVTNQGQAGYLAGVPRLGIPPLRLS